MNIFLKDYSIFIWKIHCRKVCNNLNVILGFFLIPLDVEIIAFVNFQQVPVTQVSTPILVKPVAMFPPDLGCN